MSDSAQLTASSSDLAAALQLSMRAVQHENVDVRIHALTSLRDMMHSNQVHTIRHALLDEVTAHLNKKLVTLVFGTFLTTVLQILNEL